MISLALSSVNLLTIIGLMSTKGVRGKILISVILVVISANFIKSAMEAINSRKRLEEAKEKERILTLERDVLKDRIDYKKTSEYVEESARNDLNLVKPGEKVYVFTGETLTDKSNPANDLSVLGVSSPQKDDDPNWYLWYKLFF